MGDDGQHLFTRSQRLLGLQIEARVVDGQRAMTRQLSCQRGVFAREDLSDGSRGGDHAENLAAADQGHGQKRSLFVSIRTCEIAKKG